MRRPLTDLRYNNDRGGRKGGTNTAIPHIVA